MCMTTHNHRCGWLGHPLSTHQTGVVVSNQLSNYGGVQTATPGDRSPGQRSIRTHGRSQVTASYTGLLVGSFERLTLDAGQS
jgi:hypothetical protein